MITNNPKARAAIRAAQNVGNWGRNAARRYAQKKGVTPGAYRVARECEALFRASFICDTTALEPRGY